MGRPPAITFMNLHSDMTQSEANENLESLEEELQSDFNFDQGWDKLALNNDCVTRLTRSYLPFGLVACNLPYALIKFFLTYTNALDQKELCTFNEQDIRESCHSRCLQGYIRCLEKFFFDHCMHTGLDFKNYQIEEELHFIPNFRELNYRYEEGLVAFYFVMILSTDRDIFPLRCSPDPRSVLDLGKGLPILLENSPGRCLKSADEISAMIVKVKGV